MHMHTPTLSTPQLTLTPMPTHTPTLTPTPAPQLTVATGGPGGLGNATLHARARGRRHPMRGPCAEATRGEAGSSALLVLELKMLADVGLVVGGGV